MSKLIGTFTYFNAYEEDKYVLNVDKDKRFSNFISPYRDIPLQLLTKQYDFYNGII